MLLRNTYTPLQQQLIDEAKARRQRMNTQPIDLPPLPKREVQRMELIPSVEPHKSTEPPPSYMALIPEIQKIVCRYLNIPVDELVGTSHEHRYVRPRQLAMWLCKELTQKSLCDIGRRFNRDHTTVLYNVRKSKELIRQDPIFQKVADQLCELVKQELSHHFGGEVNAQTAAQ